MEGLGRRMTNEQWGVSESDAPVFGINAVRLRRDDAIHAAHHQQAGFRYAVMARLDGRR